MSEEFQSLVKTIEELASNEKDNFAFRYIGFDGKLESSRTYGEIFQRAKQVAYGLKHEHGLQAGDRATLVYKAGVEFVEGFLGCILMGVIPVPVPAPSPMLSELGVPAFLSIVSDCKPKVHLSSTSYMEGKLFGKLMELLGQHPNAASISWVNTDNFQGEKISEIVYPDKKDTAFLQYTSGSTSSPKGVMTTFENIFAQTTLYQIHFKTVKGSTTVFWMPHYHDFTLIGGMIPAL